MRDWWPALIAQADPLSGFRYPLLAGALAMAACWILTPWVRKLAFARGAVDDPKRDDRRIHREPLPRWGGMAIFAGIVLSLLVTLPFAYPHRPWPPYLVGMMVVGAALVLFGALDDLFSFSARWQLLALLGAGTLVQSAFDGTGRVQINSFGVPFGPPGAYVALGLLAVPVTAFYIFVVTKTMDTIDGVDGLASGIATIAATTFTVIAAYGEQPRVAIVAAAIAGASLGFLRHNYNPAKIIMGTGGAYILGFLLACLSIVGALKTAAAVSLLIPMLAFGVPLFDAVFVMTRRAMSGVPITQADKRHVHHTLLGVGLSQRQVVWVLYAAAAVLSALLLLVIRNYA
jgi:UDP-GlcNAc:undecaprenyl-phosphate GlcNAc-1-phosphate transferase